MAITIITVMVVVIGYSVMTYVDARSELLNNTKAVYLAEEGFEILRTLRTDDWNTINALTVGDTYFFDIDSSSLAISSTPEVIDGIYYRSFKLTPVYRDGDDDITSSGGSIDPETLGVTVSVSSPTGTTSLTAILTNIYAI